MANLELKREELITLKEVLESDIDGLRAEIMHTDKREFREMLKHKEQILEKILSMLQNKGKS